jgi:sulfatase modifying factor 1
MATQVGRARWLRGVVTLLVMSGQGCGGQVVSNGGDSGALPPSCAPGGLGMTNCGASSESCCTSLDVDGGTYFRTYENSGTGATGMADPATVSGFRLDKYLVTVGRFRQFVKAWDTGLGYRPAAGSGKHAYLNSGRGLANSERLGTFEPGWAPSDYSSVAPTDADLVCMSSPQNFSTWTPGVGSNENLPIDCVNWYEAYAFCIWDGGFLPSEAEWEYAAAGGNQQREYPWGGAAPGTASQYAIYDCHYPNGSSMCSAAGTQNIAPVGTAGAGAGLFGQLDLAGNVWQWNLDWYATSYTPCSDCADTTASSYRVFRGGSFNLDTTALLPSVTFYFGPPAYRSALNGFRCARTP